MAISTSDFRRGLKIEVDGEPYIIVDFRHVKPGKGQAFVRTKIKSLVTGRVLERNFRIGESFNEPDLEEKEAQFLYRDGEQFHFMDTETYEEMILTKEQLGGAEDFMPENITVKILFYRGRPIGVELPNFVELKVVSTTPGVKGDTAQGGSKPATLETGAVIQVPLFVEEGDTVRVDTRTREYVERVRGA